jgi:hypothetical protein
MLRLEIWFLWTSWEIGCAKNNHNHSQRAQDGLTISVAAQIHSKEVALEEGNSPRKGRLCPENF